MTVPLFPALSVRVLLRRSILAGLLAVPVLGLACASPSPPPPSTSSTAESAASILRPGLAVDREIRGGEIQELRLPIQAGQYLRLRFEQRGAKATGNLTGPGGETLAALGDPARKFWRERLSLITRSAGEVRWSVTVPEDGEPAGRYIVEVEELRPARPEDGDRVQAEQLMAEAHRTAAQDTEEANHQALARLGDSLELWRRIGDRAGEIDALVEIGWTEQKSEPACKAAREALVLAQEGGYRKGEAGALTILGQYERDSANKSDLLERALRLWQDEGDRAGEGTALYLQGLHLIGNRDLDGAKERLERAIPLLREAGDASAESSTRVALGHILFSRGEVRKALDQYQQALALAQGAEDLEAEASAGYNLGRLQMASGDYEAALGNLDRALDVNHRLGNPRYDSTILNALGAMQYQLGDYDAAAEYYRRTIEVSHKKGSPDEEERARANLGWAYQAKGNLQAALQQYNLVLGRQQELSKEVVALALYYMGGAHSALGQPREALPYLERALAIREEIGDLAPQAHTHLELGNVYRALKDAGQAHRHFEVAMELSERLQSDVLKSASLYRWALLDRDQDELQEARDKMERSLQIVESLRSRVRRDTLRTSFFISKRDQYELYIDILMRLHKVDPETSYMAAALAASEQARARGLLDLLAEGRVDVRQGIDPELKQKELEIEDRLSLIQSRIDDSGSSGTPSLLQEQLDQVSKELQRLEGEIRARNPRYAEVRYPEPLDLQAVQALLDPDTALLQYFTGKERSFLFAITHEGIQGYTLPSSDDLAAQVERFGKLLQERGRRRIHLYRAEAFQLYNTLLAPAAEILAHKTHLLISPDVPLHSVPFEALLTAEAPERNSYRDLPYLLWKHAVSYVPSASVLASLRGTQHSLDRSPQFLAFGDPIYGADSAQIAVAQVRGGTEMARLAGTSREIDSIAKLYPRDQVALYLREAAVEENVKNNPLIASAERLHFATHGVLDEKRPWLSGLELTRGHGSKEDGKLQVYEIFDLKLDADLLVLSACETGRGEEVRGEGIVGLSRAFLYAGARSLVVSLWPVDDESTPDLMVRFYQGLGHHAKTDSLRDSKKAMIASGEYAEPYFWAPFILIGDPK
ncbi:MAG TPA: CHAT domain-containing tetratricopeptide repeat protein [Thermoanaerobaculia bacterium]|nr:CHAT domain-containing tetratricopeptide repeat protein [Thermoanaerobaculia bacterium]